VARSIQEKRQNQASVKRFYQDYRTGLQARLQVDRTAQQQLFKTLCKDALEVQKNRIKEKRTILKENRTKTAIDQKKQLEKLETEWRDTIDLLSEQKTKQKNSLEQRAKAHTRVIQKSRRGVKTNLEVQLGNMCNQIVEKDRAIDEFRERDLERLKKELLKMKFKDPVMS